MSDITAATQSHALKLVEILRLLVQDSIVPREEAEKLLQTANRIIPASTRWS